MFVEWLLPYGNSTYIFCLTGFNGRYSEGKAVREVHSSLNPLPAVPDKAAGMGHTRVKLGPTSQSITPLWNAPTL